jgi:PAS domain S-box-containing protein
MAKRCKSALGVEGEITRLLLGVENMNQIQGVADHFRLMVEAAPQAMIMVDADGCMVYVNAQAEKLFAYPREEMLSQSVSMLVPEGVRERHPTLRQQYMRAPSTREMGGGRDLYGQTSDGRQIPLEVGLNPIRAPEGDFVIVSIIDISERKRQESVLHDQAARIRAIFETAVDGIIVIDAKGVIETVNPATERLFGYQASEVVGKNIRMLMPEPDRGRHDGYLAHYRETGERRIIGIGRETNAQRKDGSIFPIELAISEMTIAGESRFTGVIRDITERRKAEVDLHEQVQETKQALQRLRDTQTQLVQSERLASLGGLVAGVSHEVNTPLGIGVTAASFLAEQVAEVSRKVDEGKLTRQLFADFIRNCKESTDILSNNLQRAAELIQSFKRVAVDQSSERPRRIDVGSYIDELLLSLKPKFKRTPHEVRVNCPENLCIDTVPGALSQILTNLLMNSLTHAFKDGRSGVMEINVLKADDGIVLQFRDNGCGIPAENLGKIFDPFFTTCRAQGGSGLGLHIVFSLVHQVLGGRIFVTATSRM